MRRVLARPGGRAGRDRRAGRFRGAARGAALNGRSSLTDDALVARALSNARLATWTGDVPVGAVVVGADGEVLGEGCNAREAWGDPTAHAEMIALRQAAQTRGTWRLEGCTLAVTLEPCTMCAGALVLARVARVVFGAWDPKAGAVGSLWDVVRDRRLNHRPEVVGGVREAECSAVLQEFFATHR